MRPAPAFTAAFLLCNIFLKAQFSNYYQPQEVHSLFHRDSLVYAANEENLAIFNANTLTRTVVNWPYDTVPHCQRNIEIALDSTGTIWASCYYFGDSLFRLSGTTWTGIAATPFYYSHLVAGKNGELFFDNQLLQKVKYDGILFTVIGNYSGPSAVDSSGNLWTATPTGLYKYDGVLNTLFSPFNSCMQDTLTAVYVDAQQHVWVGGYNEFQPIGLDSAFLIDFDGISCNFYNASNSNFPGDAGYVNNISGHNGVTWISTTYDLVKFDGVNFSTWNSINSNHPSYAMNGYVDVDENNMVWIGVDENGLLRFDGNNFIEAPMGVIGLTGDHIRALEVANNGLTWIASNEFNNPGIEPRGLSITDGNSWIQYDNYFHQPSFGGVPYVHVPSGFVKGIGDSIWMTNNDSLFLFHNGAFTFVTNNTGGSSIYEKHLAIDQNGNVWIGSPGGGLYEWNGAILSHITSPVGNFVSNLVVGPDNKLWVATPAGLYVYDGVTWNLYSSVNSPLSAMNWCGLAVDKDSSVWVAMNDIFRLHDTTWTTFTYQNAPIPNGANSVVVDGNNNKWFGCYDYGAWAGHGGVIKYDNVNWTHYYSENTNMICNDIRCLAADNVQGELWVGSTCGLMMLQDSSMIFDGISEQVAGGELFIYPNPASSNVTIQFPANLKFHSLLMHDISGRIVSEYEIHGQQSEMEIALDGISPGTYFIMLGSNSGAYHAKLIVR